ncbi:MAG TPA: dTDP-4-dehydrorhamnose reductase [Pseudoxanthomonas sp.]|nr:dTDP-4-dehydrorhamnose reductase [Pseudoxanthomonas sp.]
MKILLLGANGQVGHELRRGLAPLGETIFATRIGILDGKACEQADFDLPDSLPVLIERIAPDVVVNAAAYTAVDRAESEPDAAFRANAESPARLAEACAGSGALLVHYSTDYVFDGESSRPYREEDTTGPLGVYGRTKLAGEQAIRNSGCRHLIFRTAWVYGNYGANFMRTMLRLGSERDELRVVTDQLGTPTPARLIADVTATVLQGNPRHSGVWHLTATGETSWHGFAVEIFRQASASGLIDRAPRVTPIATSEYPTPARRPRYSCLDTTRLKEAFGIDLPDWKKALEQVLDTSPR